jgi:membrane-associated phospholipid phosphatase
VLPFEWLVVAYFSALVLLASVVRPDRRRRARAILRAGAVIAGVLAGARVLSIELRQWLPHAYLALGYWIPALLAPEVLDETAFERWLQQTESWWGRFALPLPRWVMPGLELSYLLCYPLVPVAFVVVWTWGSGPDVNRLWLAVLSSGYCCYATIPWLVGRPPRRADPSSRPRQGLARLNVFVLDRASHGLVTFPSGHAAVATSAALVTATVSPAAGLVLGIAAAAVGVGAIVGRYHYTIDVVLGIAVGMGSGVIQTCVTIP